ncbi:endopeptidase La [Acidaminobacter sp. JC074]|uniref:endopeptidase La n=1 Tax=Acidaminobacter sp. JC074 TaxID=2530199 RepID=UPI001F0EBCF7|nr:endopeptidase La [Acidaminobacter sp. JC074]MCH4888125.1 endopeptidase La [Acidaminobacter sp. JC074]
MNKHVVMPLKDMVLFSKGQIHINADEHYDMLLQKRIDENDGYAIALTLKEYNDTNIYNEKDFYHIGNLIKVTKVSRESNGYRLSMDVLERVIVSSFDVEPNAFIATYEPLADMVDMDPKSEEEMVGYVKNMTEEMSKNIPGSEGFTKHLLQMTSMNELIAALMPYLHLSTEEKQAVLEMTSIRKKSLRFLDIMIERKEQLNLQIEMNSKFSDSMNQTYRERLLREQLKSIQEELGEKEGKSKKDYRAKIKEAKLPEDIEEIALEEVDKLDRMGPNGAESNVIRSYLDLILSLPWHASEVKDIDILEAEEALDSRHYGLKKVKERIIQHLTVMKLKKNKQGSILLLVGPPGTGKTSLARSIAEALDREYVRISLGGVRDEAEIRGHRRTYIGAMPGKIIQGMKRAGSKNPVFVLDEVDKLMVSASGDPAAALLEVLDPEQNNTFNDHYLDAPYDLSDVFFIATANDLRTIPGPLRDRMEIIQIGSYTAVEKYHIAVRHLFNQSLEEHGLTEDDIKLSENAFKAIIDKYTREAGVRNLKRQLDKLVRVSSEKIVTGKVERPYRIRENMLTSILGHEIARYDLVKEENSPGVVTGLAWTPVGGDILFIESAFIPGKGSLMVTGQLGDVMKESVRISLSLIKSRLHTYMTPQDFAKLDLHVHVPAGATPKDGPSAGVTMLTAIASLVTNKPVDSKLAMTGEVSLRGAVLPVGGIKEKVIAAHRSGIKKIILPFENKRDIEDVPVEVKSQLTFVYVKKIEEVLTEALGLELPEPYVNDFMLNIDDKKSEIGFNVNEGH